MWIIQGLKSQVGKEAFFPFFFFFFGLSVARICLDWPCNIYCVSLNAVNTGGSELLYAQQKESFFSLFILRLVFFSSFFFLAEWVSRTRQWELCEEGSFFWPWIGYHQRLLPPNLFFWSEVGLSTDNREMLTSTFFFSHTSQGWPLLTNNLVEIFNNWYCIGELMDYVWRTSPKHAVKPHWNQGKAILFIFEPSMLMEVH